MVDMDPIDVQLAHAGELRDTTHEQESAMQALLAARVRPTRRPRRRPVLRPALAIGGALALLGTGVAAAAQWGPWTFVPEGDIVIAREWTDVEGVVLGTCESRLAVDEVDSEVLAAAHRYLDGIDVDALQPDAESVAATLVAVDLPERMPYLVPGGDVDDYDVSNAGGEEGAIWDREWHSDARILQDGLVQTVLTGMADSVFNSIPGGTESVGSLIETHCTTDPSDAEQQ